MGTTSMLVRSLALTMGCLAFMDSVSASPSFRGIGFMAGGSSSEATAVSANGLVIVGRGGSPSAPRAFRWTSAGGMEDLGTLPGHAKSIAYGVSADGSYVVGTSGQAPGSSADRAFRWSSGSMQDLGALPGGATSEARGVSADGSVVVGFSKGAPDPLSRGFRWTAAGGMREVPLEWATAISADGRTVGGGIAGGICPFAYLSDGNTLQYVGLGSAHAVSADGTAAVGAWAPCECACKDPPTAWRWTPSDGQRALYWGMANALSGDGAVVVGAFTDSTGEPTTAALWNERGAVPLGQFLSAQGVDLMGWTLISASGISSDGATVVGYGRNPLGQTEAWVAVIPEPSTLAVVLLCAGGLVLTPAPARRWVVGSPLRHAC